jgi:hypothetical protein
LISTDFHWFSCHHVCHVWSCLMSIYELWFGWSLAKVTSMRRESRMRQRLHKRRSTQWLLLIVDSIVD